MKNNNVEISDEMKQYYLDRIKSESGHEMTEEMKKNARKARELMKKMGIEELTRQGREDLIKFL